MLKINSLHDYIHEDFPGENLSSLPEVKFKMSKAFPYDTTKNLKQLINQYQNTQKPQEVSFRELVHWMKVGERATHYLHPYPAKLLPHIAHFFLATDLLIDSNESVLDPFSGSGTVALEANLSGRKAYFSDANPLARLITSVKTTQYFHEEVEQDVVVLREKYARTRKTVTPNVVNIKLWYEEKISRQLARLYWAIDSFNESKIKDLFWVTFSYTARKVSNADTKLSVPVRTKIPKWNESNTPNIWEIFSARLNSNLVRFKELKELSHTSKPRSECVGWDARLLKQPTIWNKQAINELANSSVGMVITSPPYAGAQKYIRASSLSLGWLNLAEANKLKMLENENIGREHFPKKIYSELGITGISAADEILQFIYKKNPLRAAIASIYIQEMRLAIKEMVRVLKPGGYVIIVIGNNEICGYNFESSKYIASLLLEFNMKPVVELVDEIKSRGLMTKRNRAASIITREWVLVYRKNYD